MEDVVVEWMIRISSLIYLLLFGSITIWGARKVDGTLTVYLWKMISFTRKIKGRT